MGDCRNDLSETSHIRHSDQQGQNSSYPKGTATEQGNTLERGCDNTAVKQMDLR